MGKGAGEVRAPVWHLRTASAARNLRGLARHICAAAGAQPGQLVLGQTLVDQIDDPFTGSMPVRIHHITFDCRDPGTLARFWAEVLGFTDDLSDPNHPGDPE